MFGCLCIAAAVAVTSVGCSSFPNPAPGAADNAQDAAGNTQNVGADAVTEAVKAADNSGDKITIGWAMAYFDHPVYQPLMQGAQEVTDGLDNGELIFSDGKNDATTQASQIVMFKPVEQAVAVEVAYRLAKGENVDYSKIEYQGTPIEVTETDDGFFIFLPDVKVRE